MRMKSAGTALRLATLLALVIVATGCAQTTAGVATETGRALCDVFRPIAWSAQDTDDTIRAAKAHNATGARVCGWAPKG